MRSLTRLVLLATAAGLLAGCSLFDYNGEQGKRYALVYGVSRYTMGSQPGSSPNLQYPDIDASDLAALLKGDGYYSVQSRWVDPSGSVFMDGSPAGTIGTPAADSSDPPHVTDLGSGSAVAPTKANIIADIQALSSVVGPNDTILIYFSGHGMMDTVEPPSTHQWFVPYQGVLSYPGGSIAGEPSTSIRDDELGSYIAKLPTVRVVLVLDTCNSGGFIGNMLESDALPPVYTGAAPVVTPALIAAAVSNYTTFAASPTGISPYNATVISAAGRDESSYEDGPPFSHGIMTYFLLKAVSSADLNHDGAVTALEAYAFIKAGIDKDWNAAVPTETFAPHISGGPVDFVLF